MNQFKKKTCKNKNIYLRTYRWILYHYYFFLALILWKRPSKYSWGAHDSNCPKRGRLHKMLFFFILPNSQLFEFSQIFPHFSPNKDTFSSFLLLECFNHLNISEFHQNDSCIQTISHVNLRTSLNKPPCNRFLKKSTLISLCQLITTGSSVI